MLYRVRIGEDDYLGSAEEVVVFMARAEGAPGRDAQGYMAGVALRIRERLGLDGVQTTGAVAFLESLRDLGIVRIEILPEPSRQRVDPREAVGDGPVAYGKDVEPDDVPV
ncbi:MAG: hypothetical protein ACC662_01080 [Planctomycetota bacterium]